MSFRELFFDIQYYPLKVMSNYAFMQSKVCSNNYYFFCILLFYSQIDSSLNSNLYLIYLCIVWQLYHILPDIDIKYTLPKLQRPPTRKTPHNIKHNWSSFSLAVTRSFVPLYIISNTMPNENGTAIVTLDDITKKPIAPEK